MGWGHLFRNYLELGEKPKNLRPWTPKKVTQMVDSWRVRYRRFMAGADKPAGRGGVVVRRSRKRNKKG